MLQTVYKHIKPGDEVHLIYVKIPERKNSFVSGDSDGGKYVFRPYVDKINRHFGEGKVKIETKLLNDVNAAASLLGVVNKKNAVFHYLVVTCDLIREYTANKELMGSISDFCARHASKTSVIIPRSFK